MSLYNIYSGLSGGFGDAEYKGTADFDSEEEALQVAYEFAVDDYQSYEGMRGVLDWFEVAEQNDLNPDEDGDEIDRLYNDEIESWIDYYVILTENDENINPEDIEMV